MNSSGHEDAWRAWRAAMASGRMHHGWILAGRPGLGKSSFALAAARELVAEAGVPQPAGDHPDIIVLSHLPANPDEEKKRDDGKPYQVKRSIGINQIREMQHRLTTRPTLGTRRAVIVDPADDLEKPASNALLKSLEEPPAGSFFLLVTHRPGRLLATIRSRCRMLRLPALPDHEIDALLRDRGVDPATRALAVKAASGSPGAALRYLEDDLASLHALLDRIAREGDPRFTLRGQLSEAVGARPDRERVLATIDLARGVLAAQMPDATMANIPHLVNAHTALVRLAGQAPTYNFDPALLIMEIGGLLASAAIDREPAHG